MKRLFLLFALLPSLAWAGDNDDWGTWLGLDVEKSLTHNLEVGLEGGLRTMDGSSKMDRWDVGASLGYKVCKYLKFNAGYSFLHDYNPENIKWTYGTMTYADADVPRVDYYKKNITKEHWSSRHRFFAEASSSVKLLKLFRISGRLRYQYTYTPAITVDRYRYEERTEYTQMFTGKFDDNNNPIFENVKEDPEVTRDGWDKKEKESKDRQVLRTRLKLELDKKHLAWSPFVSVEFHNNLASNMHFDKLRTAVGTGYKINKHNAVSLAYVHTLDRVDLAQTEGYPLYKTHNFHAISASYSLDF